MEKRKILIQLDSDPQPSVFDRVVAIDAGAEEMFSYGGVKPENVRDMVHGAIFTRGPKDLKNTALFIGGSDVAAGERLLAEARKHLLPQFGLRVSMMLDANGANTTAAAAVRAAARHLELTNVTALVLGGTGPVGHAWPCCLPARVRRCALAPASRHRAADGVRAPSGPYSPRPASNRRLSDRDGVGFGPFGRTLVIAAGAAGHRATPARGPQACPTLSVAIDLNAVPPAGIEGVEVTDKGSRARWRHVLWRHGRRRHEDEDPQSCRRQAV